MKSKTLRNLIIGSLTVQLISFNFYIPVFADEDISGQTGFAQCNEYINIREDADIESAIVGKIYNNGAITILGEQEGWYKVHSGNVEGYASAQYFVTGAAAALIAQEASYNVATVYPEALTVRAAASEDSDAIGTIYAGDELGIVSYDGGEWMLVNIDGMYGYVNAYYVDYNTYYPVAETLAEEQYRLNQEWQAYLDSQSYEVATPAYQYVAPEDTYDWYTQSDDYYEADDSYFYDAELGDYVYVIPDDAYEEDEWTDDTHYDEEEFLSDNVYYEEYVEDDYVSAEAEYVDDSYADESIDYVSSTVGQSLVDDAVKYVGNPYVYGGTSLTNGTDCSGFTQSIMAAHGIYIPRTAAEQAASGTPVSLDSIQVGDLLFYSDGGGINHVSMYMGNGQVVHASSPSTGIIISDYNYRTPVSAVRYW